MTTLLLALGSAGACGGGDDDDGDAGDGQQAGDGGGGSSGGGSGSGGNSDAKPTCPGPGEQPQSGSGTEADPYEIEIGVLYGGCVQADDIVAFAVKVTSDGTYTVTQSNGVTDLELYIFDEDENQIAAIDEGWGGDDESGSSEITAGTYYIGIYNNGAPMGTGDQESPFSLRVSGPE